MSVIIQVKISNRERYVSVYNGDFGSFYTFAALNTVNSEF